MNIQSIRLVLGMACAALALALPGCCGISPGAILDPLCSHAGGCCDDGPHPWDEILATRLHRPFEPIAHMRDVYAAETDAANRRVLRDRIAMGVLSLIDEHHERCGIALAGARAGNDAAADLAVIGLTTAASLSPGGALQSALAAAASATTGANLALNDRFLRDQSTAAILAQMDLEHAASRMQVLERLRSADDAAYPLAAVDLDLLACLYAGTPVRALASLADAAALRRALLRNGRDAVDPSAAPGFVPP